MSSEYEFEKLTDQDGETVGGRLKPKTEIHEIEMDANWNIDTGDVPLELVTSEDQFILISNLDVDLLESQSTTILDDDGMSAQTHGTSFSRSHFFSVEQDNTTDQDVTMADTSVVDSNTGTTTPSIITGTTDTDQATMDLLKLFLDKAQFDNNDDLLKAQQLLNAAAGKSL